MAKQVSSVFKLFGTDKALEKAGVWINYGDVKFLVARAGGSNIAYAESLRAKIRPVRTQVERDTLPPEEDMRINAEVYAETIIKDVQVLVQTEATDDQPAGETWTRGVPTINGEVVDFSKASVAKLLQELPDMFRDLRAQATDATKFLKSQEEADLKNS